MTPAEARRARGHGPLVSAGTFVDGNVKGVTLLRHADNGYR